MVDTPHDTFELLLDQLTKGLEETQKNISMLNDQLSNIKGQSLVLDARVATLNVDVQSLLKLLRGENGLTGMAHRLIRLEDSHSSLKQRYIETVQIVQNLKDFQNEVAMRKEIRLSDRKSVQAILVVVISGLMSALTVWAKAYFG